MAEKPSAAKEALAKVEDQLTCPVCLDPYTQPRLLTCFHVYCQHCLEKMVIRDQQGQMFVTCPKCRRFTPLPPSGVSSLQAAFHINNLFEIQEALKKVREPQKLACEKCSVTTQLASSYCRQCNSFICVACAKIHCEWEELKAHEVVSIEQVEGDIIRLVSPKKVTPRCPKHDENLKLYCDTCGELICHNCTVQIHKDHNYGVISDTFESYKEEILASLGPVEKQLETTNKALTNLDSRCHEIEEQRVSMEANIHTKIQELRKALDDCEARLVAQLEGQIQQKLKNISAQREEIEILQTQRNSCLHFVTESIRTGTPGDVMKMKHAIVKQVKELTDTFDLDTLKAREQANLSFLANPQLLKLCQEFGDLCQISVPSVFKVGIKSIASLRYPQSISQPEAELVSSLTDQSIKCVSTERGKGEYQIAYQPTIGTPIKTIDGVRGPWGVAVNKEGAVIVAEGERKCVSIFSPTGENVRRLDTRGTAHGEMGVLRSAAVDHEDNILVVDCGNKCILKFSPAGQLITAVGSKGDGPLQFLWPVGICVNHVNEKVYVTDIDAHCVQILNSDLTFCSKFGSKGKEEGQFSKPYEIACDSTGSMYVADYLRHRIQIFSPDGRYLRQFGKKGSGNGELSFPASICIDSDDHVYVGENGNYRVSVFSREGKFLKSFGSRGNGPGQFNGPFGIAVDQSGVVYVSDYCNYRVQLF